MTPEERIQDVEKTLDLGWDLEGRYLAGTIASIKNDTRFLLDEIERLRSLVPPEGSLVLLPASDLSPGVRFVYGKDLKIVATGAELEQLRQFRNEVPRVYVEWKP